MKIICVGRNYTAHIKELQNENPKEPVLFLKPDTTILQTNHPFLIPHFTSDIHFEVEVLVRINRIGKHIQEKFSHKYYNEVGLGIDFTARSLQNELKAKGLPWEKSKAFDGSSLIGTWFDKNNFQDLNALSFSLDRNGKRAQEGNTSEMLWKIDALISYISQYFTLKIGDIIFTGTPSGVDAVLENDVLEGHLDGKQAFTVKIK